MERRAQSGLSLPSSMSVGVASRPRRRGIEPERRARRAARAGRSATPACAAPRPASAPARRSRPRCSRRPGERTRGPWVAVAVGDQALPAVDQLGFPRAPRPSAARRARAAAARRAAAPRPPRSGPRTSGPTSSAPSPASRTTAATSSNSRSTLVALGVRGVAAPAAVDRDHGEAALELRAARGRSSSVPTRRRARAPPAAPRRSPRTRCSRHPGWSHAAARGASLTAASRPAPEPAAGLARTGRGRTKRSSYSTFGGTVSGWA